MHSPTRLQQGELVRQAANCRQLAQHLRHVVLHHNLAQTLVLSQRRARTLAPQRMTERRRRNQSGMVPPGLVRTPARTGRSIRASTPTRESMVPSIEPAGDAPFGERRANARKRNLLCDPRRQGHVAWVDPPLSPWAPPRSFSLRCW